MPARDFLHDAVKNALVKDGWTITHDPYRLTYGPTNVYVDLGAERILAAERGAEKIAVEVKGFGGASEIHELETAVGQYAFYRSLLSRSEPERKLYLAVPNAVFQSTLSLPAARIVLEDLSIAVVAFDLQQELLVQWKP